MIRELGSWPSLNRTHRIDWRPSFNADAKGESRSTFEWDFLPQQNVVAVRIGVAKIVAKLKERSAG
ncbi:hypothetical protein RESH_06142 [Rhodopirellula europaea SH398]|uniref:Uncharacterized protein n=1 Tax=Rhodopirellula europaea SH398 TaxID=1263868 RepID=M5RVA6_9BACT|nr:hypothetical protein RESH_06142 [Rhodopirellula europaea SH398]